MFRNMFTLLMCIKWRYHCRSLIGFPIARNWFTPIFIFTWKEKRAKLFAVLECKPIYWRRNIVHSVVWPSGFLVGSTFAFDVELHFVILTWTLYNCCRFSAHEHRIWHQWMAPMCSNIVCLLIQSHLKDQLHLEERLNCQFEPLQYHYDNGQPSIRTDIFAVKTVARTKKEIKKKSLFIRTIYS